MNAEIAPAKPIQPWHQGMSLHERRYAWLLLIVLALVPLPFGSNRPLPASLLSVASGMMLLGWWLSWRYGHALLRITPHQLRLIAIPFGIVWLWAFIQLLVPGFWGMQHPVWDLADAALNQSATPGSDIFVLPRLTLNAPEGWGQITLWLAYATGFWLALQLGRVPGFARRGLRFFLGVSVAYAVYGLAVEASGSQTILWYSKWAYEDALSSTFVNRNSYGTYAAFGLIVCLALLYLRIMEDTSRLSGRRFHQQVLINLATKGYRYLIVFAILFAALILTHSRAAVICWLVATLVLAIGISLSRRMRNAGRWLGFLLLGILLLGSVLMLAGGEQTLQRFASLAESGGVRSAIYSQTATAIADAPLIGYGPGSFEEIFRLYRDDGLSNWEERRVDHAHNTYLEQALELGIPAATILMLSFFGMASLCIQGIRKRRRDGHYAAIGLALTTMIALHSLVDFSMEIPAVAFSYAVLSGLCCAQCWSSRREVVA